MLTRILRNVVANSLRYTERGGVLIGARRRGNDLVIEVYDTGPGISASELEHIFEEFYQVQNPQRDRRLGLGLGLAIVRRLCAILGYDHGFTSLPGRGSLFRIRVPALKTGKEAPSSTEPYVADLAGSRILVIDDDLPVLNAMRETLVAWSCQVITADSCDSALRQLSLRNEDVDLIISDYRLSGELTGAQAIESIRGQLGHETPAIIVTGDVAPDSLREATSSGNHLLHKPVSAARLRSLASHLIQESVANQD